MRLEDLTIGDFFLVPFWIAINTKWRREPYQMDRVWPEDGAP